MINLSNQNLCPTSSLSPFWGYVLIFSGIIISPFYFYSSGLPQPGHIIMLLAAAMLIFLNRLACIGLIRRNLIGALFLSLVVAINIIYAIIYFDFEFILSTLHWLYGVILILALMVTAKNQLIILWTRRLILIKLGLIVFAYLVGFGGYTWWPRYEYFFNGPNQLAYFVTCLLLVYLASDEGRSGLGLYLAYALTTFIIIATGGRSAYLGIIPIGMLILWLSRKQLLFCIILLITPIFITIFFKNFCFPLYRVNSGLNEQAYCKVIVNENSTEKINVSNQTINRIGELTFNKNVSDFRSVYVQLEARGYMRVVDYPGYLFLGAGQGYDKRFVKVNEDAHEIHSSLLAVLFYYGILGLFLFLLFIWRLFEHKKNLLFLAPLFVYGLFTYGLRSPYFWFALGFLALMPDLLNSKKNTPNESFE